MSALAAAVEAVAAKQAELQALLDSSVQPVLDAIAATGQAHMIYVYGRTPEFNDGEPCEHSTTTLINLSEIFAEEKTDECLIEKALDLDSDPIGDILEGLDNVPYKAEWRGDSEEEVVQMKARQKIFHDALAAETGIPWDAPTDKNIMAAIEAVVVPALDREFGTNYQVLYILEDGKYVRSDDEYDCGY